MQQAQDRFENLIAKIEKISNSCQYCKQHKALATGWSRFLIHSNQVKGKRGFSFKNQQSTGQKSIPTLL